MRPIYPGLIPDTPIATLSAASADGAADDDGSVLLASTRVELGRSGPSRRGQGAERAGEREMELYNTQPALLIGIFISFSFPMQDSTRRSFGRLNLVQAKIFYHFQYAAATTTTVAGLCCVVEHQQSFTTQLLGRAAGRVDEQAEELPRQAGHRGCRQATRTGG